MNINFLKAAGMFFVALAFVLAAVFLSSLISKKDEPPVKIVEVDRPLIKCPMDSNSFSDLGKKLTLLEDKPSNGTEGALKGYRVNIKRTGTTSSIACGYLYYRVSFNKKPIEQKSMDLFMNPKDGQFGGHIIPSEKDDAIIKNTSEATEVLMPLEKITYDGLDRKLIKQANWASLLNVGDEIQFDVALSADTPLGNIDLVQLAYKCVNPETGKETNDCSLSVVNIQKF